MSSLEPFSSFSNNSQGKIPSDSENVELRHVAAIDIGTNSTHLLVASINPVLNTFSVDLTEKSTTRLGEKDPETGELTEEAMARVLDTLKRFK